MLGKKKCKLLREIRQKIASENDIPYVTEECKFKGECKGTCPKCESELAYLEAQLEKRRNLGLKVTASAVAIGLMTSAAGCAAGQVTEGDMIQTETENTAEFESAEGSETTEVLIPGFGEPDWDAETEPSWERTEGEVAQSVTATEPETEPEWILEGDVAYEPTQANNANG